MIRFYAAGFDLNGCWMKVCLCYSKKVNGLITPYHVDWFDIGMN